MKYKVVFDEIEESMRPIIEAAGFWIAFEAESKEDAESIAEDAANGLGLGRWHVEPVDSVTA